MTQQEALTSGYVGLENGKLYYETAGRGHTLVLIHAAFLDSRMWDREFKLYSENYQVIRYDVRGFGKSDRPRDKFSDYKDLYSLLKHLGVGKACLLGISNGGRIALDFVSMHPEMVEALILVGTGTRGYQISGPDEEKEWNEFDARVMAKEEAKEKAIKEKRLKDAVTIEVDLWASAVSAELREPILKIAMDNSDALVDPPGGRLQVSPQPPAFARLEETKIPTLLIIGTKDGVWDNGDQTAELDNPRLKDGPTSRGRSYRKHVQTEGIRPNSSRIPKHGN